MLERLVPDSNFHSILKYSCGAGVLTEKVADYYDHTSGVDIAPSMIKFANEKNSKEKYSYFLNQKNDLSLFEKDKYDYVCSFIIPQHMQPKFAKNYILEFIRIVNPRAIVHF